MTLLFYAKTSSRGMEMHSENPLYEDTENARINRELKFLPIDQFADDLKYMFNDRMSFYGHSEIAQCQIVSYMPKENNILGGITCKYTRFKPPPM